VRKGEEKILDVDKKTKTRGGIIRFIQKLRRRRREGEIGSEEEEEEKKEE